MNYFNLFLAVAAISVLCSGCEKELCKNEEEPQSVDILLNLCEDAPITKSQMPLDDSSVKDLNIYIFNSAGGLVYHLYSGPGEIKLEDVYIYSKHKYSIFALANWGSERVFLTMQEALELKYVPDNLTEPFNDGQGVIMSGLLEEMSLYDGQIVTVGLRRPFSKVKLSLNKDDINGDVELTIKRITVNGLPKSISLFKDNSEIEGFESLSYTEEEVYKAFEQSKEFYMFENMQGSVNGATNNKSKVNLLTRKQRECGTYVEIECYIVTNKHRGTIIYKFYLGGADNNCNIVRNTEYGITIYFKGDVSENENSMSVNTADLKDRLNFFQVIPRVHYDNFFKEGKTLQLRVQYYPSTTYYKGVTWSSTDETIATVDDKGLVTFIASGYCDIIAVSVDKPERTSLCSLCTGFN